MSTNRASPIAFISGSKSSPPPCNVRQPSLMARNKLRLTFAMILFLSRMHLLRALFRPWPELSDRFRKHVAHVFHFTLAHVVLDGFEDSTGGLLWTGIGAGLKLASDALQKLIATANAVGSIRQAISFEKQS